jgi:thioredoxin reductase (NADPH)
MAEAHCSNQGVKVSGSTREVIIIGSGPAGLTAAIYTARANLHPLIIEGQPSSTTDQPGGQLMLTTDVENFPGFPDGIMGPELMGNMRAQAERFGAEFITTKVTRVDFSGPPHRLWATDPSTGAEVEYSSHSIIVSTGAQSLMLGLASEQRLIGHGVSTCATCDGFFFRGKQIAVVGGGDSALEEANFLTKFGENVVVIHRRHELRASKILQERAFANPKLSFVWDSMVTEVLGETKVEGIQLTNTVTGEKSIMAVSGLFVAIGHEPNTGLFKGQIDMDDAGYLVTSTGSNTNVHGVFACGDVQDHTYRQAITAAGSGCMAAIDAERWLDHAGVVSNSPEAVAAG